MTQIDLCMPKTEAFYLHVATKPLNPENPVINPFLGLMPKA